MNRALQLLRKLATAVLEVLLSILNWEWDHLRKRNLYLSNRENNITKILNQDIPDDQKLEEINEMIKQQDSFMNIRIADDLEIQQFQNEVNESWNQFKTTWDTKYHYEEQCFGQTGSH